MTTAEMELKTQEYLAKIRKTVAESKRMIESVKLRFAETDRLLADCGTSREEVKNFRFTAEQIAAVNDELQRRGMRPVDMPVPATALEIATAAFPVSGDADFMENMENRRRKFGVMMKRLRM